MFDIENKMFRSVKHMLYSDGVVVLIRNPKPVSRFHFVVTTSDPGMRLGDVSKSSIDLLMHMKNVAILTMKRLMPTATPFVMGFLATHVNSCRLQMHVLSADMTGEFMNDVAWKMFTTKLFIPLEDVQKNLQQYGKFRGPSHEDVERIFNGDVQCRHCDMQYTNFRSLQRHMKVHNEKKKN